MALSNMRNEPRREITEQGIGIVALLVFLIGGWKLGSWTISPTNNTTDWIGLHILVLVLMAAAVVVVVLGWYLIHSIGESVCDWLSTVGLDPRPSRDWSRRR